MSDIKNWDNLNKTEQTQIGLMLVSLKEFSYAFDTAQQMAKISADGSTVMRFYMNAMYHYVAAYFLVTGGNKLSEKLRALGSGDLLGPIEETLATELGTTTFRELLSVFRSKFLVHQSFTVGPLEEVTKKKYDLAEPGNGERFMDLVNQLFAQVQELYVNIAVRFPEISELGDV